MTEFNFVLMKGSKIQLQSFRKKQLLWWRNHCKRDLNETNNRDWVIASIIKKHYFSLLWVLMTFSNEVDWSEYCYRLRCLSKFPHCIWRLKALTVYMAEIANLWAFSSKRHIIIYVCWHHGTWLQPMTKVLLFHSHSRSSQPYSVFSFAVLVRAMEQELKFQVPSPQPWFYYPTGLEHRSPGWRFECTRLIQNTHQVVLLR